MVICNRFTQFFPILVSNNYILLIKNGQKLEIFFISCITDILNATMGPWKCLGIGGLALFMMAPDKQPCERAPRRNKCTLANFGSLIELKYFVAYEAQKVLRRQEILRSSRLSFQLHSMYLKSRAIKAHNRQTYIQSQSPQKPTPDYR